MNTSPPEDDAMEYFSDDVKEESSSETAVEAAVESFNRRLECLVCGAAARGYNFGVTACESCKAFFRRNALRREVRPCCHGGNCQIQEENRKACPTCRIKKCFRVGMKKELIHPPERLMMRAKPKSWQHNRRLKSANDSDRASKSRLFSQHNNSNRHPNKSNDEEYESNNRLLSESTKSSWHFIASSNSHGSGRPSNQSDKASCTENEGSLLLHIFDKSNDSAKPSTSAATVTNQNPRTADVGLMCYPVIETDDNYYYLSSKFHHIQGLTKAPFEYNPNVNNAMLSDNPSTVEDGFAMYEYLIRRMVCSINHMPFLNRIERSVFVDIVKEKLFGAAQIFSCLYFNKSNASWTLSMKMADGIVKEENIECQPFFYNAFRYLTRPCSISSVAILKMGDVDSIYKANMNSFKRICDLSKGNGIFMIALMGYYLTIDEGFAYTEKARELKDIMIMYEKYMMQLQYTYCGYLDISEFHRDILGLMQLVKWIETRYIDLGKYMEQDRLPPLLQEILTNDTAYGNELSKKQ